MDDGDDDDPLPLMEDSDGADSPKPHDGNDQIARSQSPQQQAQGESTEPQNDRASADPAQSRGTKAERRARRQRESSDDVLILECPHCQGTVQILALNCRIFRSAQSRSFILDSWLRMCSPSQARSLQEEWNADPPTRIAS
eukprot:TRINITY_DN2519_c0_g1_i2.p1 TRINITY_DN2519_c0_g1~~TRINITY_DN2519_c0_g1_i2.p1  ORF type:complete len:141 (+),score=11.29 TRINITY_DN2519_c0_g1_i2:72-494(+)